MARIFVEQREPSDDLRRLFHWLSESSGGPSAEYVPPLDVFETADTVEILVDLPGVALESLRVACSRGVLVIAGQKSPGGCEHRNAAFHLAERGFGRFARAIRLSAPVDAGRAQATLTSGELHVIFPRIEERRGREIAVPVSAG